MLGDEALGKMMFYDLWGLIAWACSIGCLMLKVFKPCFFDSGVFLFEGSHAATNAELTIYSMALFERRKIPERSTAKNGNG